tara:strand:+ start:2097 stop:2414 length:318 start_codon:yes stop_codon:yes gene_type:complete
MKILQRIDNDSLIGSKQVGSFYAEVKKLQSFLGDPVIVHDGVFSTVEFRLQVKDDENLIHKLSLHTQIDSLSSFSPVQWIVCGYDNHATQAIIDLLIDKEILKLR